MAGSDQRIRAPRFEVGLAVVCEAPDGVWAGTIIDMSESGAFVQTDHRLPVGTEVTLVPQVDELPPEIRGVVMRVGELDLSDLEPVSGIAFRLVGLTLEHFAQVRAYLRKHGRRRHTRP